jgi:hypothetical protein
LLAFFHYIGKVPGGFGQVKLRKYRGVPRIVIKASLCGFGRRLHKKGQASSRLVAPVVAARRIDKQLQIHDYRCEAKPASTAQ